MLTTAAAHVLVLGNGSEYCTTHIFVLALNIGLTRVQTRALSRILTGTRVFVLTYTNNVVPTSCKYAYVRILLLLTNSVQLQFTLSCSQSLVIMLLPPDVSYTALLHVYCVLLHNVRALRTPLHAFYARVTMSTCALLRCEVC